MDWSKQQRLTREQQSGDVLARVSIELAARIESGGPVGLMLHHDTMDDGEFAALHLLRRQQRQHRQPG